MLVLGSVPFANPVGTVGSTDLCNGADKQPRVSLRKQERRAFPQPENGMIVEEPSILNPHPLEFERFLYASVGKDRNDYIVTVLTTFARLGLDPWKETAKLVAMERDPARLRLGLLLARFRDVPALASGHARIAGELSMLLPDSPSAGLALQRTRAISTGLSGLGGTFWMTLAIVVVVLHMLLLASAGSGD